MDELKELRDQIDEVDRELSSLLLKRMSITKKVGEYKLKNNMKVLDPEREKDVLQAKVKLAENEEDKMNLVNLYESIMAISRRQQRMLMREVETDDNYIRYKNAFHNLRERIADPMVVYQGVPGAYSEMACMNFFGKKVRTQGLEQFEDTFLALKNGMADYAVVPIENNSTGAIRQICDLLVKYDFYIVGETTVEVAHCLMALPGASFDTITHVYSHEQGLFQSEQFLNRFPNWVQVPAADTAGSAEYVAKTGDITKAAICSARAAELYGLNILARNVNFNSNNTTRFVVVSPKPEITSGSNKISTIFTLPHRSGSLHEIMTIFAVNGLNILKLESRPRPDKHWEYLFFLEFSGSLEDENMDNVIREVSETSAELRVLGNFPENLDREV